jgi:hypothetical protein
LKLICSQWSFNLGLGLALALVTSLLSGCSGSKLSKDDLRLAAGDVRSFAAAADLLAKEQLAGHLTGTFVKTQSQLLLEKVNSTNKTLNTPAPDLEPYRTQLVNVTSALAPAIGDIENSGTAEPQAFAAMTSQARGIEEALKNK